jgi:hypothetical protein
VLDADFLCLEGADFAGDVRKGAPRVAAVDHLLDGDLGSRGEADDVGPHVDDDEDGRRALAAEERVEGEVWGERERESGGGDRAEGSGRGGVSE